jgi:hypothetical protein
MHEMQFREKSRAWVAMCMPDSKGNSRPMNERIKEALNKGCFPNFQFPTAGNEAFSGKS